MWGFRSDQRVSRISREPLVNGNVVSGISREPLVNGNVVSGISREPLVTGNSGFFIDCCGVRVVWSVSGSEIG